MTNTEHVHALLDTFVWLGGQILFAVLVAFFVRVLGYGSIHSCERCKWCRRAHEKEAHEEQEGWKV